jgi:hypothetical protein
VQSFVTSVKALSRKDIQYGAYATSEQVLMESALLYLFFSSFLIRIGLIVRGLIYIIIFKYFGGET